MIHSGPPSWLEHLLLWFIPEESRESIGGDLYEEYVERRRRGLPSALAWYGREIFSFALEFVCGGRLMKMLLRLLCLFTLISSLWLVVMENILRHPGFGSRSGMDAVIAAQALITLVVVSTGRAWRLYMVALAGGVFAAVYGGVAIGRMLESQHFEGFVIIIGVGLVLQGLVGTFVLKPPPAQA